MPPECFCGCGATAVQLHHCVYRQAIRRAHGLEDDPRNLVPVGLVCHGQHHSARKRYAVNKLPDSVFNFAAELLGPGAAHEWIARRYEGSDHRLHALLTAWEAAA